MTHHSSEHNATVSNTSLAIDWKEALYLATQGGTRALGLPSGTGTFKVGSPFDAQQSTRHRFFLMLPHHYSIL
jgi:cytosine/adenosine deaminase-related metal-dependent hydrolase